MPKQIGSFEYVMGMNIDDVAEKLKKMEDELKASGKKAGDTIKITPKLDKTETKKQFNFLEEQAKRVRGKLMEAFGMQQLVAIGMQSIQKLFTFIGNGMKSLAKYNQEYADSFKSIETAADNLSLRVGNTFAKIKSSIITKIQGGKETSGIESLALRVQASDGSKKGLGQVQSDIAALDITTRQKYTSQYNDFIDLQNKEIENIKKKTALDETSRNKAIQYREELKASAEKTLTMIEKQNTQEGIAADKAADIVLRKKQQEAIQKNLLFAQTQAIQMQATADAAELERLKALEAEAKSLADYIKSSPKLLSEIMTPDQVQQVFSGLVKITNQIQEMTGATEEQIAVTNTLTETMTGFLDGAIKGDMIEIGASIAGLVIEIVDVWADTIANITKVNDGLETQEDTLTRIERLNAVINNKISAYDVALGLNNLSDAQKEKLLRAQIGLRSSVIENIRTGIAGPTDETYDLANTTDADYENMIKSEIARGVRADAAKAKFVGKRAESVAAREFLTQWDKMDATVSKAAQGDKDSFLYIIDNYDFFVDKYAGNTTIADNLLSELSKQVAANNPENAITPDVIKTATERTLAAHTAAEDAIGNAEALADAEAKRLALLEKQTEELKKQKELTASNIEQMVAAGLIDPDNFFGISQIDKMLTANQYTFGEKLGLYSQIGATGVNSIDNSMGNNIGVINITVNEASGETVDSAMSGNLALALKPEK